MLKTLVAISRDHSGSMSGLRNGAMKDYNSLIEGMRKSSADTGVETLVSVVECGIEGESLPPYYRRETISRVVEEHVDVKQIPTLKSYVANGGSTPLWDSVGLAIDSLLRCPVDPEDDVSYLVMIVTDGGENSSRQWNANSLRAKINELQATDRWTFVFRVPKGYGRSIQQALGIPSGNILEWETTERGMEKSTTLSASAVGSFYSARAAGSTSSKSFYTDLSAVSKEEIQHQLVDISAQVRIHTVNQAGVVEIKPFIEQVEGNFEKGTVYYQLTKPEKAVQEYKVICVHDLSNGHVYAGHAARQLLGLPTSGTIRLVPKNHAGYEVFIQSTSLNRRLPQGTKALVWKP